MTLSIAMCTCNSALYVQEQLDSFLKQTRPPDELVICDDCSTDGTLDIVRDFAARSPFPVNVHPNPERLGIVRNFEKAIGLCRGDSIALSDDDNVSFPQHLARLEAALARPNVGIAFSDATIVDERLAPTGDRYWERLGIAPHLTAIEGPLGADALVPGWFVGGACMAFRSMFRQLVLPVPADIPMIHDGWIAAVIAGVASVRSVDEPLIQFRQHPRQQIGAPEKRGQAPRPAFTDGLRRRNSFDREMRIAERILERLTSQGDFQLRPGVRRRLAGRVRHLHARTSLPPRLGGRLSPVLLELVTGRYHRYSNGALSAAKDLVIGPLL